MTTIQAPVKEALPKQTKDAGGHTPRKSGSEIRREKALLESYGMKMNYASEKIVTRREIRKMKPAEQIRFCNALKKLMESPDGPGTSEYHRIAGYHGWPSNYCVHGGSLFPAWHRAYLVELELALQKADVALGGSGDIGLPYWDWLDIDNEPFPNIILEQFGGKFPEGFFEERDENAKLRKLGWTKRGTSKDIQTRLKSSRLFDQAMSTLQEEQYWLAASTQNSRHSIESPHNSVHVCVGYPMSGVAFAAFDPIFFLHHNNIDRLYESYLKSHPDSKQEFKSASAVHAENGKQNYYMIPLQPFKDKFGNHWLCEGTFDIESMGYRYDVLYKPQPQQLRELSTFVVFEGVDGRHTDYRSYNLFVFVMRVEAVFSWTDPTTESDCMSHPAFAGLGAIFGGKGLQCSNCETRPPFNVNVDITSKLAELDLSRTQVGVRVVAMNSDGDFVNFDETKVPAPVIRGPIFEDEKGTVTIVDTKDDCASKSAKDMSDTSVVQEYLNKLGFDVKVDGWMGPKTAEAVNKYQAMNGLKVDGLVGPETKACMLRNRFDAHHDHQQEDVSLVCPIVVCPFKAGQVVRYWVGSVAVSCKRFYALVDIEKALQSWSIHVGMFFRLVEDKEEANLVIRWSPGPRDDQMIQGMSAFDGRGSLLAQAMVTTEGQGLIVLDMAEKWFCESNTANTKLGASDKSIQSVVLHEFGHVLGLKHAHNPFQVMSPYYTGAKTLTKLDIEAVRAALPFPPHLLYCDYKTLEGLLGALDHVEESELLDCVKKSGNSEAAQWHVQSFMNSKGNLIMHKLGNTINPKCFLAEYKRMACFKAKFDCLKAATGRTVSVTVFKAALATFGGPDFAAEVASALTKDQASKEELESWYDEQVKGYRSVMSS